MYEILLNTCLSALLIGLQTFIVKKYFEKSLHICKVNYDNKLAIYKDTWKALILCVNATNRLYPQRFEDMPLDEKHKDEYTIKKYTDFNGAYSEFVFHFESNMIFYNDADINNFRKIIKLCFTIGEIYKMYEIDVKHSASFKMCRDLRLDSKKYDEIYSMEEEIQKIKEKLCSSIRKQLYK